MKASGTRTYLEVKVGQSQCVAVLLYLRRPDMAWFNDQNDRLFAEFLHLIEQQILPRMLTDELEENHHAQQRTKGKRPPTLGPGGIPIAEKNHHAPTTTKRKRMSKKALAELERLCQQSEKGQKKKDVYYAFGKEMQLAYRLEEVKHRQAETLVFANNSGEKGDDNEKKKEDAQFRLLKKLSKRILVWCYPLTDQQAATDPDPPGGGFPRPDLIPISELFRRPLSENE